MSNAPAAPAEPFDVAVSMTGSTIAKTYDQRKAVLQNIHPVIKRPVRSLRLDDTRAYKRREPARALWIAN